MSALDPVSAEEFGRSAQAPILVRLLQAPATGLALLALAIVQQSLGHHNGDNSWLMTVAESLLSGARAYVDVIETNPPGAFLIYMPGAWLARLLHLPVELVTSALIFAGTLAVLAWMRAQLLAARIVDRDEAALFMNAGVFALLAVPGFSFGEREHIAAVWVLPIVVVYVLRDGGQRVSLTSAIMAGLLAAGAAIAKPHFVFAVLMPFAWLCWRRRSLRPLFGAEHITAVGVCALYLASLPLAFPAFFDALPAIVDVYVPVRTPWTILLTNAWFLCHLALIAAIVFATRNTGRRPLTTALMLASAGFALAYLVQVKGWVNHGLPGVALALLAAATAVAPALRDLAQGREDGSAWQAMRRTIIFALLPLMLGAPILFGTIIQFTGWEEYEGLTAAVRRTAPAHPRIATITGELDLGHPLVRRVEGTWVMRPHSLWLMTCAYTLLQTGNPSPQMRARLEAYVAQDARGFREDVERARPDLIIAAAPDEIGPVLRHADIVAALAAYRPVERVGKLTLYARRD